MLQTDPIDTKAVMDLIGEIAATEVQRAVGEILSATKHAAETDQLESNLDKDTTLSDKTKEKIKGDLSSDQEDEADAYDEALDPISSLTAQFSSLLKDKGMLGKAIDKEAIEQAAIENAAAQTNEELDRSQAEFTKRISVAFGVGIGADEEDNANLADLYSIDKIIAQIEADRAQLELLSALLDAVGGIIGQIVPILGGIVKAKQFSMNVVAAVRRCQELVTFTALVNDAKKATSPQAHSLLAQVDELNHQLNDDLIQAALHLGQCIAITADAACEMSGIAAAGAGVAKAVESGLESMEQAKDFLYRKFKERKVKRAWQRYRAALDNPEDRIGIIKAIRMNPTLAKYAVSFGALEMGDPFAKEALRECGLNDMVLAQENTNADKVVRFLECKFADDIQVVGVVSFFAPDSGDPITFASWAKNKKAAQKADGKVMLDASPTNNIDNAFAAVEASASEVDKSDIADAVNFTLWETHQKNLDKLVVSLQAFKPKTTTGTPFQQFQDYLNELAFAAERESKRMVKEVADEQSVRGETVKIYKKALESIDAAKEAIATGKTEIGMPPKPRKIDEVIVLCTTGPAKILVGELKSCASASTGLNDTVGFVDQAVKFAGKKAEKSKKLAEGRDRTGSEALIEEALETLLAELDDAVVSLETIRASTQASLDKASIT